MKTLKYLIGAALVAIVAPFAVSPALAVVTGSAHDLTGLTLNAGTEQVCVYCHTPHNGTQGGVTDYADLPLWNRVGDVNTIAPAAFQTYTSPTLDAGTAGVAGDPTGVSLGCLSCHDGATALDALLVSTQATAFTVPNSTIGAVPGNLGGDLRNDHPISITYDAAAQGVSDWVASPALPLFGAGGDQVECASCHNPHDTTNGLFLRMSNDSSNLCLACHVK